MSRFIDEAQATLSRWHQSHEGAPHPAVRVFLSNGDRYDFTGLAIAPSQSSGFVAVCGAGWQPPIVVLRDEDILRVEISPVMEEPFGFESRGH